MDDKNTDTITSTTGSTTNTTDSTVKAPQVADSEKTVNEPTSTPTPTSTSTVNEPTSTPTGGGENTNMANDTTKKVDPKFDGCQTYVVVKGDALVDIADKFGVGLNQLRYFNGVPKATFKISEGQTIYIPKGEVKVPVGE